MKALRLFSLGFLIVLAFSMAGSIVLFSESGALTRAEAVLHSPGAESFCGTDSLGRDLCARILSGGAVSLFVGFLSSLLSLFLGILVGGLAALSPAKVDNTLMRITEVLISLPGLMLMGVVLLALQTILHWDSIVILTISLGLGSWMPLARILRNVIRVELRKEYIEGARALGAGPVRLLLRHLIPNVATPVLIYWGLQIPHAILAEGVFSFLGIGVKAPQNSWGLLLDEGWRVVSSYPHLLVVPSLVVFLTIFSMNILLEAFRLRIEPRQRYEERF